MSAQSSPRGLVEFLNDQKNGSFYLTFVALFGAAPGIIFAILERAIGFIPAGIIFLTLLAAIVIAAKWVQHAQQREEKRQKIDRENREKIEREQQREIARAEIEDRNRQIRELKMRIAVPEASIPSLPRAGLIALVSQGAYKGLVTRRAILHHCQPSDEYPNRTLQYLWLIHSEKPAKEPETKPNQPAQQSSWKNARCLEEEFSAIGVIVRPIVIKNEHDASEVFRKSMRAYLDAFEEFSLGEKDIVADITGGTKTMTIGLAFAGIPLKRDLQYMLTHHTIERGIADQDAPADSLLINVNFLHETPDVIDPDVRELLTNT